MIYGQPVTFGGVSASGEISITDNGIFDVGKYATANVNVTPVLLWTNASPTSAFAAQTVSVASSYDGYIVECKAATSTSNYQKNYVPADGSTVLMSVLTGDMFTASNNYIRSATGNDGKIVFTDSMRLSSFGANTGYCIPTRIWGVKFTL